MDIAKFNQELSYKVTKANGLEKHRRFQEAIDLWLDISEMALNMSKMPNIEIHYKSMLIDKTKQIIKDISIQFTHSHEFDQQCLVCEGIAPPRSRDAPKAPGCSRWRRCCQYDRQPRRSSGRIPSSPWIRRSGRRRTPD